MLSRFGRWRLGGVCAVLLAPGIAPASVLLFGPFDYPNGPLISVSAGTWVTHSGVAAQVEVTTGRANLSATRART
jgi:hypothetical protein